MYDWKAGNKITYYKEAGTWRDMRDFVIDLEPLTPEHAAACEEYRRLRREQGLKALREIRTNNEGSE